MYDAAVRPNYPLFSGFVHLAAGLACGFTGLAAGYAIGHVGDSVGVFHSCQVTPSDSSQCVRALVHESKVFVGMVLILIFAEVLGLYGCVVRLFSALYSLITSQLARLIVALIMNTRVSTGALC